MSHVKTQHIRYVIDEKHNQGLTIQQMANLTDSERDKLHENFLREYPLEGVAGEEPILLPFCKRGATLCSIQQEYDSCKGRVAQKVKEVLHKQHYYGKSYKEIYK